MIVQIKRIDTKRLTFGELKKGDLFTHSLPNKDLSERFLIENCNIKISDLGNYYKNTLELVPVLKTCYTTKKDDKHGVYKIIVETFENSTNS